MSTVTTTAEKSGRQIIRSDDIWFSDGGIILQVGENNQYVQFRVHKSILTRSSDFFRDLFAIPQSEDPSRVNETLDGTPVVCFKDDSIQDWTIILSALHDPFFFKDIKADHIVAMFKIGKKYFFPKFLAEAQNILVTEYPTTLSRYRQIASNSTIPNIKADLTVKLFRIFDEGILPLSILPVLCFERLRLQLHSIIFNLEDAKHLSANTRALLLAGYGRILYHQADHTFAWLKAPRCTKRWDCGFPYGYADDHIPSVGPPSLRPFITSQELNLTKCAPCTECRANVQACLQKGGDAVWNLLPSCFDLPSWEELTENRRE